MCIINDSEIININMTVNFNDYPVENICIPILVINAKNDPMIKIPENNHCSDLTNSLHLYKIEFIS